MSKVATSAFRPRMRPKASSQLVMGEMAIRLPETFRFWKNSSIWRTVSGLSSMSRAFQGGSSAGGFAAGAAGWAGWSLPIVGSDSLSQAYSKRGTRKGSLRKQFEGSVVLGRGFSGYRQAKPDAFRLCRKVWVEDSIPDVLGHTWTAIRKYDQRFLALSSHLNDYVALILRLFFEPVERIVEKI